MCYDTAAQQTAEAGLGRWAKGALLPLADERGS